MNYSTTYYYSNRAAARQFARWATGVTSVSTYTETESWVEELYVEGATVTVLHIGGIISGELNSLARQSASDYGEEKVLRVTVKILHAGELEAHNYADDS